MPCRSDYMEPNEIEKEASRVYCLLDDLDGNETEDHWWYGNHPKAYNKVSQQDLNKITAELCGRLKALDHVVGNDRLVAWWKAHKEADAKREAAEKKKAEKDALISELEDNPAVKAYLELKKMQ